AWVHAEAQFAARDWPFDMVKDAPVWASTWLPSDLNDATFAEPAAGYHRGDLCALSDEPDDLPNRMEMAQGHTRSWKTSSLR
ncbi:MAG: hypothetical protein ABI137_01990, partial [Antricoccus sp.]